MSDLLAVFGPSENDAELIAEIARVRPTRVTVLIADVEADWALDETPAGAELRDRLAALMAAIERETGATVTGLAASRAQLTGWRFDREVTVLSPDPLAHHPSPFSVGDRRSPLPA